MTAFPPHERLAQVVGSAARRLPEQLGVLLAAERFSDGLAAARRLAAPGAAAAAAAALPAEEAERLAALLLQRWAAVAEVELDPAVALVGPAEVLASPSRPVWYELATAGIEDGWTAEWTGAVTPDPDGRRALLDARVPEGGDELAVRLLVRVFGRAAGRRQVLVAERTVRVRGAAGGATEDATGGGAGARAGARAGGHTAGGATTRREARPR